MKKNVIIIALILIVIIVICVVGINVNSKVSKITLKENGEYEKYLKDEIYGTDVVTLINKAISNNETNNITKDEKGLYITDNQNSIIMDLVMITDSEKDETTTYRMETISKVGITEFIKNFNTAEFECTRKEYHSQTGKIAYIDITQKSE